MKRASGALFLAIATLLGGTGGCRRLEVDGARLNQLVDAHATAALETAPVKKALDDLFAAVSADPQVKLAGNALLGAIGDDKRLQPAFAHLVELLGQHPTMQAVMRNVMKEHPGAKRDELGALMQKRVGAIFAGPRFNLAFEKAFERFLERPEIADQLRAFGEAVVHNPRMAAFLASTFSSLTEGRWRKRLIALNGGSLPDKERATELLADDLFSADRMARWYVRIYTLPTTKRAAAAGVAKVLEAAAFRRLTSDLVVALVSDAAFQQRAIDCMALLVEDAPGDAPMEQAIAGLLEVPVVSTAVAAWMKALMANAELAQIGDGMLKQIVDASEMRASFAEIADLK